jgi:transposase
MNKRKAFDYKGGKCQRCSLISNCLDIYDFHHKDSNKKEFNPSHLMNNSWETLAKELDKCDLLCSNCHVLEHTDIEFFNINRKIIEDKFNNYKEKQGKINRNDVYRMYESGMKQNEIAKYFNASNGSISDILSHYKELKNIKINKKVDKEVVYELYDKGYRKIDIIRELKVSKCTVYKIIRDRNK